MRSEWHARVRSGALRPLVWVFLLATGAVAMTLLAARESDRARRTADVLMKDYTSFIADRFVSRASETYRVALGLQGSDSRPDRPSPIGALQLVARERDADRPTPLPDSAWPGVLYIFAFDAGTGRLEAKGTGPTAAEREALIRALRRVRPDCGANQALVLGNLAGFPGPSGTDVMVSGIVHTDGRGAPRTIYGVRVDESRAVESLLQPLVTPASGCDCLKDLLPSGLTSVADPSRVISLRLVDPRGRVLPAGLGVTSSAALRRPLAPDVPLPGWSVDVALDPEAVRPLLPYGGRGAPWSSLAVLGGLALASAVLAIRSLRREVDLVRARQDFIANVSHELKTPLARIRLFNELLDQRSDGEPRGERYRKVIDRECRRLTYLVDNVLDFSRHERGTGSPRLEPIDLRTVAEQALESFRAASDAQRFSLQASLDPIPTILGSPVALSQVLINLLDNAVKYSPQGSPVDVTLQAENGFVAIRVADRGPGIPASKRERIFEDFYRIDSGETQHVAGAGLGLPLVRRTVTAHGGRVSVDDRPGGGSIFTVRFPQAPAAAAPSEALATP